MKVDRIRAILALVLSIVLLSCTQDDPGPLRGTWRMNLGLFPMTVQFRSGETEMLGVIDKVSYEQRGSDVIVHVESGHLKGSAMRYTITGPNSARSELGNLQRIK